MPSFPPKEQALAIVVRALSPYVGPTMAGASVRGLCEKLGLDVDHLPPEHLEQLLEAIAPGLDVYVGREKARAVVSAIRVAVSAQDGHR